MLTEALIRQHCAVDGIADFCNAVAINSWELPNPLPHHITGDQFTEGCTFV